MPSNNSETPNVNRAVPELTSVPARPNSRPTKIMATALMIEPCAITTAESRPSTISEKYSTEVNLVVSNASAGASAATNSVPTQPAKNDPIAAIASAGPARPCRAI